MRCPKCGKEISHLRNFHPAEIEFIAELGKDGGLDYYQRETIPDDSTEGDFECPECNVVLAHNEEDAIAFLKGEGISQERAEYYMGLALERSE